ncbi:MAG: hybrid fatty acyl-AMP ligase/type I polyketide synthase, partial [Elainellaceae cyanobacterium]
PEFYTLAELLRFRAATQPDKQAFVFLRDGEEEDGRLTYGELDRQARAIAAALQAQELQSQRALLLYSPNLEFVSAFMGCLYAKVLAVPAYPPRPNQTLDRLRAIMADSGATVALTTEAQLGNMERSLAKNPDFSALNWFTTDTLTRENTWEQNWSDPQVSPTDLAFLQYTSGSTGTPKGVMVSHGNLIHNAALIRDSFADTEETRAVSWLPPYHDMGLIGGVLQPLYLGIPMALMSPVSFLQRPFRWLQTISRYRATTSGGPNFAYDLCIRQITEAQKEQLDLSSWSLAFSGAEPVRADTLERFVEAFAPCGFRREAFYPCYGMAETTLFVTGGDRPTAPTLLSIDGARLEQHQAVIVPETPESRTLVSCGHCHADQRLVIAHPDDQTFCDENQVGEIWVSGDSIAQGYWHRPQQTQDVFQARIHDPNQALAEELRDRPFLRTGDLGFLHQGELYVTGRIKDLIIIRGLNHYPQDIELTVDQCHDDLRQGCNAAFSIEVNGEERLLIAQEVERRALRRLKVNEVTQAVRQAIAQHHQLQTYGVLLLKTGSIPKTSSGKIRRHACKDGFLQGTLDIVGQWLEVDQSAAATTTSPDVETADSGNMVLSPLTVRTPSQSVLAIQSWLVTQVATNLGISPSSIDPQEPFARYGLDSVTAIRLSGDLEEWLGRSLSPTLVYDYPTIAALAAYLGDTESASSADDAQTDLSPSKPSHRPIDNEAIAIVGMGCRFPGASSPDEFWNLLKHGRDAVSSIGDRWHPLGESSTGGFLDQVDQFDPKFFGISPREAIRMDPQQRILLEVTWEALEYAAIAPHTLAGSDTGVFIGISNTDYSQLQTRSGDRHATSHDPYSGTGNAHSIAANRLSYILDLRGPSLTVDTACSSSLVALHVACQHLAQGDCTQAIVGGVNLILSPDLTSTFTQAGMMAADGRCKTFDASADGYVRGEGCGVVVLKPLSIAQRDGDSILAVIQGTAVNQDGRSNGLTAPNGPAQQAVIRQAMRRAGVTPSQIGYVDAHGTGTALGDPIELNSLKTVLMQGRSPDQACWVGSVKTNIGHLESAAGIAGLMKVVLALQHREIPPHLHFQTLNPHIHLTETPIQIPTQPQDWTVGEDMGDRRIAGVSSFGFGGTNAHAIVAESPIITAPVPEPQAPDSKRPVFPVAGQRTPTGDRPQHLVTLSAKSEAALKALVTSHLSHLSDSNPDMLLALGDLGFTLNTGRSPLTHRLAIAASDLEELQQHLSDYLQPVQTRSAPWNQSIVTSGQPPAVAFLFTGQGSQYINMGHDLYQTQPTFRRAIDQCNRLLRPHLETPLLDVLYPTCDSTLPHADSLIDETSYTQPALFALEFALAQLWLSWGVQPSSLMGHSVGEYVAACLAGVFSLEDGLKLIAARSRLMQSLPQEGTMAAIFASETRVRSVLQSVDGRVDIAAVNGPRNIVISGERQAVDAVVAHLAADGIESRSLQVSHAFHSSLMEPMLDEFRAIAQTITYALPTLPIVSNLTGRPAGEEIASADYWCRHVRQPVMFASSINTLQDQGYRIFLEIGPTGTLCSMGRHITDVPNSVHADAEKTYSWLPSLRSSRPNWTQLLQSLGRLYTLGVDIDWAGFDRDYPRQRLIGLPTYPWQRQRYWFTEGWESESLEGDRPSVADSPDWHDWLYQPQWVPLPSFSPAISSETNSEPGTWLIFADRQGMGQRIAEQLRSHHQTVELIFANEDLAQPDSADRTPPLVLDQDTIDQLPLFLTAKGDRSWLLAPSDGDTLRRVLEAVAIAPSLPPLRGVVHLWSIGRESDATVAALNKAQTYGCESTLYLIQSLDAVVSASKSSAPQKTAVLPKLWVMTQEAVTLPNVEPVGEPASDTACIQAPLWGLSKVIAWEHPTLWGGIVDVTAVAADQPDSSQPDSSNLRPSWLNAWVQQSLLTDGDGERWTAMRENKRYGLRLQSWAEGQTLLESPSSQSSESAPFLAATDATVLITGGLGSLGLTVAEALAHRGVFHLTLVSRRSPTDISTAIQSRLDQIRAAGTTVQVMQADVTQAAEVNQLVAKIQASGLSLNGVIHGAGVLKDGLLAQQTWSQFSQVMAPKVAGAWNLHRATQDLKLDFFVLFSSAASLLGSPGQGNYAAANAFLDELATMRRSHDLPALSINWGLWDAEGMAANLGDRTQARLTTAGMDRIAPEQGIAALMALLTSKSHSIPAQVGVMPIRWSDLASRIAPQDCPSYLKDWIQPQFSSPSEQSQPSDQVVSQPQPTIFSDLLKAADDQQAALMLGYLRQQMATVLQLDVEAIAPTDNLLDLGLDSLMVMEAMNQCRQDLQLMLYPREFYERPQLNTLAAYLTGEFRRIHQAGGLDSAHRNGMQSHQALDSLAVVESDLEFDVEFETVETEISLEQSLFLQASPSYIPSRKLPGIVFILSSPRSGSTLLRVMLAGHPKVFAAPELHLLPFNTLAEREGRLTEAQLNEGLQRSLMELKGVDASTSQQMLQTWIDEALPIDQMYGLLQSLAGDRLLIDKSPTYAINRAILDRAEDLFEGARYIHLVRHPYSVIESFVRMRMDRMLGLSSPNPYRLAEQVWSQSNRNIEQFLATVEGDRQLQLRYEDLVAQPQQAMESLCELLEIPFEAHMVNPYEGDRMTDGVHSTSLSVGDPNFSKHRQLRPDLAEVWRTIQLPHALGLQTQELAHQLGYELPEEKALSLPQHSEKSGDRVSSRRPYSYPQRQESELEVRGLPLCLCSWGKPSDPVILCLHGILDQGTVWEPVAQALASRGYYVVAPDLRGHGRSGHVGQGGSYHLLDFLSDVDTLVQQLLESSAAQSLTLVGHSMGSVLAALVASLRPQWVRSLVLVDTILPADPQPHETATQLTTHLNYLASPPQHSVFADAAAAAARLRQATPSLAEKQALSLAERILEPCEGGVRWRWDPLLRTRAGITYNNLPFSKARYVEMMQAIQVPTSLIYGDKSQFNRPSDLEEQAIAFAHASRLTLPGGHNVHLDSPDALVEAIAAILENPDPQANAVTPSHLG